MSRDIEQLLKGLPLRAPSDELDGRVLECLALSTPTTRRRPWLRPLAAAGVAAALLIAAVAMYQRGGPAPTDQQATATPEDPPPANVAEAWDFQPVRYESTRDNVDYSGTVVSDEGDPYRAFRRQVTKEVRLVDEQRGIEMQFTMPREEVILIRADSQ